MKTKLIKYTSLEEEFIEEILIAIDKYTQVKLSENIKTIR